jgi:hypothetical protein
MLLGFHDPVKVAKKKRKTVARTERGAPDAPSGDGLLESRPSAPTREQKAAGLHRRLGS